MIKPVSLTLRLFLSILALNIFIMCVVVVLGLRSANIKISEEYDAQLITETNVLWQILEDDAERGEFEEFDIEKQTPLVEKIQLDKLLQYAQWRAFRVWKGNTLVVSSGNTDSMPKTPAPSGFSDMVIAGETWRVFALHVAESGVIVETFENLRNRELLQRDILFGVAGPVIFMLPLLGLLFSFAINFGLKGLHRLASRLSTRSPSDLSRLASDDIPKELRPLTKAINTLLATLESSLAHEREFIDHAAHELRTPLSALKLQAQLLAKSQADPVQKAAVQELLAGVDRTARLIDQLLLLSRVAQQEITLERVNVLSVTKETISLYAVRLIDKHIAIELLSDENLFIQAQPELLRTLVGIILDNAIKYTPEGGEITVSVAREHEQLAIVITDTGSGIPETERARVFDRFYRLSNTKQAGSGLGLAIASQIAGLLRVNITLATPDSGKGLRVTIAFPYL